MEKLKAMFGTGALTFEEFCAALGKDGSMAVCGDGEYVSLKEHEETLRQLGAANELRASEAAEFAGQLAAQKKDAAIDMALVLAGARSLKAARALIDEAALKAQNGGVEGLGEQIERLKDENPYLFAAGTGNPPPPAGGGFAAAPDETARWRAEAGLA